MVFVQRPRIARTQVPGRSFVPSSTVLWYSMPKSTSISSLSASAASSSLGGRGGTGRGFGFVSFAFGPAPNVLPQSPHSVAFRGNSAWHPEHVFVPRAGGATVAGAVAFTRLAGGPAAFFLRGGMLPDLF